jgi:hypothetical protein
LLGIIRGHWKIPMPSKPGILDDPEVLNAGIASVTPIEELSTLIESDPVKEIREEQIRQQMEELAPTLDSAFEEKSTEPEFSRADFEAALRKVSRKIAPQKD